MPFERCVAYAAEHLGDSEGPGWVGMDTCHEISARDDTGVDEVFQVIARKLVERRGAIEAERLYGPAGGGGGGGGAGDRRTEDADPSSTKESKCC